MIRVMEGRRWIMAEGCSTRSSRVHRTICLPLSGEAYREVVRDPAASRRAIDECFRCYRMTGRVEGGIWPSGTREGSRGVDRSESVISCKRSHGTSTDAWYPRPLPRESTARRGIGELAK